MSLDVPALSGVDRQTLREQSLHKLREAICGGQLAPGTRLIETELSDALSVSRGTLREALRHLVQEGLIVADERGRLLVRVLSPAEVADIFSVRGALESLAVEALCAAPDRTGIVRQLRETIDRLATTDRAGSDLVAADLAFHQQLCELTGNGTLVHSWQHLSALTRATTVRSASQPAPRDADRHTLIVDAIEAGDAARAREATSGHLRETAERIVSALAED
ncbi:GntR family transcriptional regulator [Saccharopolyspora sp. K220]|uniref:GntR family transcriptional regulator n=1 Tax=Saccharopolyspora soli TaxID=2926618 RepID=UPI001F596B84|nr:GntR family transcriptional regulator [Saccharopolyspora soli]MCI2416340.1 GntR family transcriptional regulator [Saccharopolyspora soli]